MKDYSSLRENAEGGFIGDVEHCKTFQSTNMMMLDIAIDKLALTAIAISFRHLDT